MCTTLDLLTLLTSSCLNLNFSQLSRNLQTQSPESAFPLFVLTFLKFNHFYNFSVTCTRNALKVHFPCNCFLYVLSFIPNFTLTLCNSSATCKSEGLHLQVTGKLRQVLGKVGNKLRKLETLGNCNARGPRRSIFRKLRESYEQSKRYF